MGLHSGPVYRVADINANQNVAGGGINIAQRVMDCGDAGHILASQSVADMLGHLSSWKDSLHDLGEADVKHGVRVHLYNLYTEEVGNAELPRETADGAEKDGCNTLQGKEEETCAWNGCGRSHSVTCRVVVSPTQGARPDREGHHRSRRFHQHHGRCNLRRHAEDSAQRFPAAIAFLECALRQRSGEDLATDDPSGRHETHARGGPRALPAGRQQSLPCRIDWQSGQRIRAGVEGGELPERRHAGRGAGDGGVQGEGAGHAGRGGIQAARRTGRIAGYGAEV